MRMIPASGGEGQWLRLAGFSVKRLKETRVVSDARLT